MNLFFPAAKIGQFDIEDLGIVFAFIVLALIMTFFLMMYKGKDPHKEPPPEDDDPYYKSRDMK